MSDYTKDTIDIAETIIKDNDDLQRQKRFAQYSLRGINKKVNQQIKRDFTTDTEKTLIDLANSVNADESSYELMDAISRWFLNTIIGKFLKKLINTQKIICDSYNYFGDTVRKIFQQARSEDDRYSNKISSAPMDIADNSVKVLEKLNDAFTYYEKNKEYGCTIKYSLSEYIVNDSETISYISKMISSNEETKITDFVNDKNNITVFNDYSEQIYEECGIENGSSDNSSFAKQIKGHEKLVNKIVDLILKKMDKKFDDVVNGSLNGIFDDEKVSSSLSELIDATGITGTLKGTLKIYILKQLKDQVYLNYKDLFEKIHTNESNDYKSLKLLYDELKALEIEIIEVYKDINEFKPNKQVQANEWLGEIEDSTCGCID